MSTSYEHATAGIRARAEITKILRRFGCESIGFMDDFEQHEVLLAFKHRGRQIQFKASAKGWAAMYLRENPWTTQRRQTRVEYEQKALRQGYLAANSAVRDWAKGQISIVESGFLQFEAVFLPWMLTNDGRPVIERLAETNLLPAPAEQKVVSLK